MSSGANVDEKWLEKNILESPAVRQGLNDIAARLLPICQRLAYQEGCDDFADSLRIETGTRPGTKSPTGIKRPYARVIAGSEHASEQEHGSLRYPRHNFFRRAASQL